MNYKTLLRFLEAEENKTEEDITNSLPPVNIEDPREAKEREETEDDKEVSDETPDPATDPGTDSDVEIISLFAQKVEISKKVLHEEPILQIKSLLDPSERMTGHVKYPTQEDLNIAYNNLIGFEKEETEDSKSEIIGGILNYMDSNRLTYSTAFPFANILAKEIGAIKKNLTPDEIGKLNLSML